MKHAPAWTLAFISAGTIALAAAPATAVTAAGPYYATPSWDQTLPASTRFVVLSNMNGEAVLDRETGLVWEQSPSTSPVFNWLTAGIECADLIKGNRKGWRLPTYPELASLVDPSAVLPGPTLPAGHPFQVVASNRYWSATTYNYQPAVAFVQSFMTTVTGLGLKDFGTYGYYVWCVRGGQGVNSQ